VYHGPHLSHHCRYPHFCLRTKVKPLYKTCVPGGKPRVDADIAAPKPEEGLIDVAKSGLLMMEIKPIDTETIKKFHEAEIMLLRAA
jgi:hypothetical protein